MTGKFHCFDSDLFKHLCELLEGEPDIFLVGGAVRDTLLGRNTRDLDFVMPKDVRPTARRVAAALKASFYMLDEARNTARIIYRRTVPEPIVIDFAALRADDLEGDLRDRDFTINAMALRLQGNSDLIDPLGGSADLRAGVLRACSPTAFADDPLRLLRGVRLALELQFRIHPQTYRLMQRAVPLLARLTAERQRDELFKMLSNPRPGSAIRLLDRLGAIATLLPELAATKSVEQPEPHRLDVWQHTLFTLDELEKLYEALVGKTDDELTANPVLGMAAAHLAKFRLHFQKHFARALNPHRSPRSLLFMAALYHDVGKPLSKTIAESGEIHFYRHEKASAEATLRRARALELSRIEANHIAAIIRHHMRLHWLVADGKPASRRAIYRFFRAAGEAGIEVCLLSLADTLATYRHQLPQDHWQAQLEFCAALLHAWWEKPLESVKPTPLLSGDDLQTELALSPGPQLGRLLAALLEAQAAGEITTRAEALEYARRMLDQADEG